MLGPPPHAPLCAIDTGVDFPQFFEFKVHWLPEKNNKNIIETSFKPNGVSQRVNQSFSVLGVVWGIFHFYSNFNRTICKQSVETLIKRGVLWHLILVCIVGQCPTKRFGLKSNITPYHSKTTNLT